MINTLGFLIALAVFVVALVAMVGSRIDIFTGGLDLGLAISILLVTYPPVLNRGA